MNPNLDTLPSLGIEALDKIYGLIDEIRADEVHAAKGVKVAHTRVRVKLAKVANLCTDARKAILAKTKTKEEPMEKYGVDEKGEEAGEKAAAEIKPVTCPKCGSALEKHGEVSLCLKCGSEPFEQK